MTTQMDVKRTEAQEAADGMLWSALAVGLVLGVVTVAAAMVGRPLPQLVTYMWFVGFTLVAVGALVWGFRADRAATRSVGAAGYDWEDVAEIGD